MTNARGPAIARAAEAMLRALGGTDVTFRFPVSAAAEQQARQLGLDAPVTQDISISPVVVRASGDGVELLIAPSSIAPYMQDRGYSAEQFFSSIFLVLHGGREYRVKSFQADHFAGSAYLYRITVVTKS